MKKKIFFFCVMAVFLAGIFLAVRKYNFNFNVSLLREEVLILHATSDMHAGGKKNCNYSRERPGNIVYPREWEEFYKRMLDTPGDVYVTLGDNISDSRLETKRYKGIAAANEEKRKIEHFGPTRETREATRTIPGERVWWVNTLEKFSFL